LYGGKDGVRGFGPDEWFGLVVGFCNEAIDGGLKLDDRCKDAAAFEPVPGELGKRGITNNRNKSLISIMILI
jgi:hypothetical protein